MTEEKYDQEQEAIRKKRKSRVKKCDNFLDKFEEDSVYIKVKKEKLNDYINNKNNGIDIKKLVCNLGMDMNTIEDYSGKLFSDLEKENKNMICFIDWETKENLCINLEDEKQYWKTKDATYVGILSLNYDDYVKKKKDTVNAATHTNYFMNFSLWTTKFFLIDNINIITTMVEKNITNVFALCPVNYKYMDNLEKGVNNYHNLPNGDDVYIILPVNKF